MTLASTEFSIQEAAVRARLEALFPSATAIPPEHALPEPQDQREVLVGGELREWPGPVETVLSPICLTGSGDLTPLRIGTYPLLGEAEAREQLAAAASAYDHGRGRWPTLPLSERIRHVEDFTHRMVEARTEVVRLLMWEIGKTYADSLKEFDRTVDYIKDTIAALKDLDRASSRFTMEQGIFGQIRRSPLGVVLCMGPFNYPLNETFTTLIPALIMGNTVVFKPPKLGVLLFRPLLRAFRDSFPPGVVNSLYGDGRTIIPPLMSSGQVDVLAFIGTSKVADIVRSQHPKPHRLRCVLGLDAKNPAIVLGDADLDLAVKECLTGALSFNGQRCTALKILFVEQSVAEAFIDRFTAELARLKSGMPWESGVSLTPLPEPNKTGTLTGYLDDAVKHGARVVNPGGGAARGTFFHPAVVYPVSPAMRLFHEEQFGPIVPVVPFTDVSEPIRFIEESQYGQQVSLFSRNPEKIAQLVDPLVNQVCRVNVNSQCQRGPDTFPFTGRKDSAEGTLSVSDALRVFTIRTLVAARETDENKRLITAILRERRSSFLSTDFIF